MAEKISPLTPLLNGSTLPTKITTIARVCPLKGNVTPALRVTGPGAIVFQDDETTFHFDRAFDGNAKTQEIFKESITPLLKLFLSGFSSGLIAYGQTGSGKSYSLTGDKTTNTLGLIQLSLQMIVNNPLEIEVVELYNNKKKRKLFQVESAEAGSKIIDAALEDRKTRETTKNTQSSRSHLIFHFISPVTKAKFSFADLAGSETVDDVEGSGAVAQAEGSYIRKSLFELTHFVKNVVTNPEKAKNYDPLVKELRWCLNGNAASAFLFTVSSDPKNVFYSKRTGQFGKNLALVKVELKIVKTQIVTKALLKETGATLNMLLSENQMLLTQNEELKKKVELLERQLIKNPATEESTFLTATSQSVDLSVVESFENLTTDKSEDEPQVEELMSEIARLEQQILQMKQLQNVKSKDFNEGNLQKLEDQKRKLVAQKEELQRKLIESRKSEDSLKLKNRNLSKELQKAQFAQQKQSLATKKQQQMMQDRIDLLQRINLHVQSRKSTPASAPQTPRKTRTLANPAPVTPLRSFATPVSRPSASNSNSNFTTPVKTLFKSVTETQDPLKCTLETFEKENGFENQNLGETDRLFLEAFFNRVVFCRDNQVFSSCLPDAMKFPVAKINSSWILVFLLCQYFPRVLRLLASKK